MEAGRPEGLPRTAAIMATLQMQKRLQRSKRFCIPLRVAKPGRHLGDGRTISRLAKAVQGIGAEEDSGSDVGLCYVG